MRKEKQDSVHFFSPIITVVESITAVTPAEIPGWADCVHRTGLTARYYYHQSHLFNKMFKEADRQAGS